MATATTALMRMFMGMVVVMKMCMIMRMCVIMAMAMGMLVGMRFAVVSVFMDVGMAMLMRMSSAGHIIGKMHNHYSFVSYPLQGVAYS